MKKNIFLFLLNVTVFVYSQNTVGTLFVSDDVEEGYTLFTSFKETFLIDNCGQIINQWTSVYNSGHAVYIMENGDLLRAGSHTGVNAITLGGAGGIIQRFDWDGNILWEGIFNDSQQRQHHDFYPLPNGNLLVLVAETMTAAEAIALGRDPSLLPDNELYTEKIIEITPTGSSGYTIVWEWNMIDHVVQDFDNTLPNFGVIANHPELLDINFLGSSSGNKNWLHCNSLQYNEELNQIILSARFMSETYIIDHTTTTAEAASHTGGTYGKGGDFLYRWGNPQVYDQGTASDQKLFGQHYPHFIPTGLPHAGDILIYNNGFNRTPIFSEVVRFTPTTTAPGVYAYPYDPSTPDYIYTDPVNPSNWFSHILSSAQQLHNGNILTCTGASGYFREIDSNGNIVWEYINPLHVSGILSQGEDPSTTVNNVFRATKYPSNYQGFVGKDVTPGVPIELNPDLSNCNLGVDEIANPPLYVNVYPNPCSEYFQIHTDYSLSTICIFDVSGRMIQSYEHPQEKYTVSTLSNGMYWVHITTTDGKVFQKNILVE